MSRCAPPGLHLNHWHTFWKSYPGSELLCTSWAPLKSLTCPYDIHPACELLCTPWVSLASLTHLYENLSRVWVVVHLLGSIWTIDMPWWKLIQQVSCCALPGLYLDYWHAFMKSYPGSELLWTFWIPFESLISIYEFSSSMWVVVHFLGSFKLLTCLYEIPSSKWIVVVVHLLSSICITNILSWNPIQGVSCCAPSGLHLNHWHAFIKFHQDGELLCTSWAPLVSLTCIHESYAECELLCTSWALFESLTCLDKNPSSMWVVVHLLHSI